MNRDYLPIYCFGINLEVNEIWEDQEDYSEDRNIYVIHKDKKKFYNIIFMMDSRYVGNKLKTRI
mgnify:CR=1 FL=1